MPRIPYICMLLLSGTLIAVQTLDPQNLHRSIQQSNNYAIKLIEKYGNLSKKLSTLEPNTSNKTIYQQIVTSLEIANNKIQQNFPGNDVTRLYFKNVTPERIIKSLPITEEEANKIIQTHNDK